MNHFDGFVALVSIGVVMWVWDQSVVPWLDETGKKVIDWLWSDEESDNAR